MDHSRAVQIEAPADVVWGLLADVEGWPRWTTSMRRIDRLDSGPLREGSRASVEQPQGQPMEWTVSRLEPGRTFTWQAHASGMTFTAGHGLTATDSGVQALLTFELTGPMAWLGALLAGRRIRGYVDTEAEGLKRAAERQAG